MARKQKTIHYIYKTTCLVTDRYYIGMHSTYNIDDAYMGSGKRLRYSIRKYGVDNHIKEILEYFATRELLVEAEKKIITNDILVDIMCMNLMSGGTGGFSSENHRIKCTKAGNDAYAFKIKKDEALYKAHCERLNVSRNKGIIAGLVGNIHKNYSWLGKNHSDKTKRLLSTLKQGTGLGNKNSQYGTCWITKDGINKKIKLEEINQYQQDGWIKGRK